jgi:hypothetical protein
VSQSNSGKVQFTTVLLVLGIAIAGYFAVTLVPAFSDNYTARQAIESVVNQGWRRMGKEEIHKQVLEKLSQIGTHLEQPADGAVHEVSGLPVDDDSVVVTCTDERGDCMNQEGDISVTVTYNRVIPLPYLTGKTITLHFAPTCKESLKPVNWD